MEVRELNERAIRHFAERLMEGDIEIHPAKINQELQLEHGEARKVYQYLLAIGCIVETMRDTSNDTLREPSFSAIRTAARLTEQIVTERDRLDRPDVVADAIEWSRTHKLFSLIILAFVAFSFVVNFANSVCTLIKNLS